MKIFITGVGGQLGYEVVCETKKRNLTCVGSDIFDDLNIFDCPYVQLDITNKEAVEETVLKISPEVIIHCAAWTNVDAAEDNKEKVFSINVEGTRNLVESAKKVNAKFIYISTDYVFSGEGENPWMPDCELFSPQNIYGQSKLLGEQIVSNELSNYYIVRISWAFGKNKNFVETMLRIGKQKDTVSVVNDQFGTPTYMPDVAKLLIDMSMTDKYGKYHVTNEGGYITWYDFTKEIYKQARLDTKIIPVSSSEYKTKAKRPSNSRLDKSKLKENGFNTLPDWRDALERYLATLNLEEL